MRTGISSLTAGTYLLTPKSERLITPGISKMPILLTLASSVTGLVTPCTVRSPVILRTFSPVFSTLVLLNAIVGYLVASRKSGLFSASSSFATPVSKPSTGKVTEIDDLVRSALSSSMLPSILSKRAAGLEKPKWFQPKTTPLCEASISYFSAAGTFTPSAAKTDKLTNKRLIKAERFIRKSSVKLMWKPQQTLSALDAQAAAGIAKFALAHAAKFVGCRPATLLASAIATREFEPR